MENNLRQARLGSVRFIFGALGPASTGGLDLQAATVVRRSVHIGFGWALRLEGGHRHREWKEVLSSPPSPGDPVAATEVCVRHGAVDPDEVTLGQLWGISPDDRNGAYVLQIFVDDRLIEKVSFSIDA